MISGEKDTPLPGLFKGSLAFSQHFLYDCIPNWAAIKPRALAIKTMCHFPFYSVSQLDLSE